MPVRGWGILRCMHLLGNLGGGVQFFWIALFFAVLLAPLLLLINFAVRDARRRGKSALLVSIACVFFFPWGWIAWLLFRPDPTYRGKTSFELQDYRAQ
jgi:hypothetical protein